jgi:spore germination protein
MKSFEYGDHEIGKKEIMIGVASMLIGVGILTLPSSVASTTEAADGWMSIIIGGGVSILFGWVAAKLASRFPKKTFFDYTALIATKPVAILLTLVFGVYFLVIVSIVTRMIANISKLYLFDRTPVEVISLIFLLLIIYGVSGSSASLLRLNLLFLPIVIFINGLVLLLNINLMEIRNLKPFFTTGWTGVLQGTKETTFSFLGYAILLFYIALMNQPKQAPKAAVYGISIPLIMYLLIYLTAIATLSNAGAANIIYPTIEIAKEVEVPGKFFERFDAIFFTIWIMTIFNTAAMAFDVSIIALGSIFRKVKKITWICILSPIIYLIAMLPQSTVEMNTFGEWISYIGIVMNIFLPPLLLLIAKMRKVKGNG